MLIKFDFQGSGFQDNQNKIVFDEKTNSVRFTLASNCTFDKTIVRKVSYEHL